MSTQEKQLSPLEAMLAQYETNNKPKFTGSGVAKVYDLKNYFTTFIGKTAKSGTKEFRILPSANGTPISEMYGHKMKIDGEWKTFPCLQHEKNEPCPLCEARELLLATGDAGDKELAKKYSARLMYIAKVIDRENEEDGVKFWRFNHDFRKEGIFDKIHGLMVALKKNKDVTDPENGRDLSMSINKNTNDACIVSSIVSLDSSPLSEDAEKSASWLADTRTWHDVYATRNYDYLAVIVKTGHLPVWDVEDKKWVGKDSLTPESNTTEGELNIGVENVKANVKAATKVLEVEEENVDSEEIDDLPF